MLQGSTLHTKNSADRPEARRGTKPLRLLQGTHAGIAGESVHSKPLLKNLHLRSPDPCKAGALSHATVVSRWLVMPHIVHISCTCLTSVCSISQCFESWTCMCLVEVLKAFGECGVLRFSKSALRECKEQPAEHPRFCRTGWTLGPHHYASTQPSPSPPIPAMSSLLAPTCSSNAATCLEWKAPLGTVALSVSSLLA